MRGTHVQDSACKAFLKWSLAPERVRSFDPLDSKCPGATEIGRLSGSTLGPEFQRVYADCPLGT